MSKHKFLFIDLESRCAVELKTRGANVYWASHTADVLIACYALDDGPVKTWLRGDPCPAEVAEHITAGGMVSGWNVFGFERLAFEAVLGPRYGWPVPALEQYSDTAQLAAAMSLPRALGDAATAMQLPIQKDKDGMRLIRKFSVPRRARKDEDPTGLYWNEPTDHPDDFAAFARYCSDDTSVERLMRSRLVPLSAYEHELAIVDAAINARGLRIDTESAAAALRLAEKAKRLLDREMKLATGGYVKSCTQVGALVEWVQSQGVELNSAAKAEIEELLEADDLPKHVRHAVMLRQEAAKTSVSKLSAFLKRVSADGRLRGAFLFCAAGTGRWSSVGAQVHNLPRPRKAFGDANVRLDVLFDLIRTEDPQALRYFYGDELGKTLWLLSDAIRGFIWAGPGKEFVQADYSGIEGVVAAWFAGEDWKVKAIREIAADEKLPDLYRRAAAAIFNCTTDDIPKSDVRRQVGKVSELALQYAGGPGAFRSMARNYSLKLAPLYPIVWEAADETRRAAATRRYENALARKEPITAILTREEFIAAEIIKIGWRQAHPAIVQCWYDLEDAARNAVENPGAVFHVRSAAFMVKMGFLWLRLPSGRCLAYGSPRLKEHVWVYRKTETGEWSDVSETMPREEAHAAAARGEVKIEREARAAVTVLGVNSVTKKWERYALYSGLIFENLVQAIARDLLANGMKKAEAADYTVIGHVHDELITEVPRGFGDVAAFERLICEVPDWCADLPLTASGWRGKRYRKD